MNDKAGDVAQWRLDDNGRDGLSGRLVRTWATGVETEGCVVDDANGWLHLGAQNDGIWRYDAHPDGGTEPTIVDTTGVEANSGGRLAGDVEGLTLYVGRSGDPDDGYLIAASQGNNTYVVYDRAAPHVYRGTFRVVARGDVDGTEGTDGLDATSTPLGPAFPSGMLVVMDGANMTPAGGTANQNFKMVSWQDVADALRLD